MQQFSFAKSTPNSGLLPEKSWIHLPSPSVVPTHRIHAMEITWIFDVIDRCKADLAGLHHRCQLCWPLRLQHRRRSAHLRKQGGEIFIEHRRFHGDVIAQNLYNILPSPIQQLRRIRVRARLGEDPVPLPHHAANRRIPKLFFIMYAPDRTRTSARLPLQFNDSGEFYPDVTVKTGE